MIINSMYPQRQKPPKMPRQASVSIGREPPKGVGFRVQGFRILGFRV